MKLGPSLYGTALGALLLAPLALPAAAASPALAGNALTRNVIGHPAASQAVDFVVHLPVRNLAQLEQLTTLQGDKASPLYHHFLTPAQFRESFGPTAHTMQTAMQALRVRGLSVTKAETQLLHVRGAAAKVEAAFNTHLGIVRDARGQLGIAAAQTVNTSGIGRGRCDGSGSVPATPAQAAIQSRSAQSQIGPWRLLVHRPQAGLSIPRLCDGKWQGRDDRDRRRIGLQRRGRSALLQSREARRKRRTCASADTPTLDLSRRR